MDSDQYLPAICQVLRAQQKDKQYLDNIESKINDSFKILFGDSLWIRYSQSLSSTVKLLYFTLTTGMFNQTLGEEYCHLVQSFGQFQTPSILRRNILVLLYSFHKQIFEKFAQIIKFIARGYFNSLMSKFKILYYLMNTWDILSKLNAVIFNFTHMFADLPKRLTSIRQLSISQQKNLNLTSDTSKYFGWASLIEFVLSLVNSLTLHTTKVNQEADLSFEASDNNCTNSKSKCLLCLGKSYQPSVTLCGHVFCWNCIIKYVNYRHQCPACQRNLKANDIVFLRNYE